MSPKKPIDQKWIDQVTPEIVSAVRTAADDGAITCERARKLAEDLGVPYILVGAAATKENIHVHNCGLGCF